MIFEWDKEKNRTNRVKHGISFEEAALIFRGPVLTTMDNRHNYGEIREISIGRIQGTLAIVVVHTDRNNVTRLISARPANRSERRIYDEYCAQIAG